VGYNTINYFVTETFWKIGAVKLDLKKSGLFLLTPNQKSNSCVIDGHGGPLEEVKCGRGSKCELKPRATLMF